MSQTDWLFDRPVAGGIFIGVCALLAVIIIKWGRKPPPPADEDPAPDEPDGSRAA